MSETTTTSATTSTDAYYRLRGAQHYFNCAPQKLDARQQAWLDATLDSQRQLEARILATTEAGQVVVSDAALKEAMEEIQAQYVDSDGFLDDLEDQGLTVSQLSDLLERQLRVEMVLERQAAAVAIVSMADAHDWYLQHPEKFRMPERRFAWHLLITYNEDYPENHPAAVRERLSALRGRIHGLDDFKQLAQRHSECPSALRQGEMGWIPRGQLFAEIEHALFQLEPGSTSSPVETEVGLHLVYCQAVEPEHLLPFEQVADKLRAKLTEARRRQAQRDWLRELK